MKQAKIKLASRKHSFKVPELGQKYPDNCCVRFLFLAVQMLHFRFVMECFWFLPGCLRNTLERNQANFCGTVRNNAQNKKHASHQSPF